MTFLADVLLAYVLPEHVVVCEFHPVLTDLGSTTKGDRIKVAEDLEGDLAGEYRERVHSTDVLELFGKHGELGEATHGEDSFQDDGACQMG